MVERIRSAQANLGGGEMTLPRDLDLTDADRRAMAVMREVASMPPGRKRADEISLYAARRIREELGALGMSQSRLAVQTGMDPMYLSRRLSGKVDLAFHEVVGIAAVLDRSRCGGRATTTGARVGDHDAAVHRHRLRHVTGDRGSRQFGVSTTGRWRPGGCGGDVIQTRIGCAATAAGGAIQ